MAKALLGYSIQSDPRMINRLASENRALRPARARPRGHRLRLPTENDALAALATEAVDQDVARDGSLAHT